MSHDIDYSRAFEIIKRFDDLPENAVVQTKITALVLGLSERTIRYHPKLPRIALSQVRYGQRVGDIRQLVRQGASEATA
jgi:hypothetical protein